MFGKPTNPYDEIINKATDEKQTEMNWETALTVWDKVNEDGEAGARNSVNALTKRLTHRSANVQLFSLTLAGALVNNCGPSLHKEISGKAFTQALTRLINDRTTHDSVKKEALKSIEEWVTEHRNNSDFDLMNDTYEALKRQNHKFPSTTTRNPSPPRINDDVLRKEEEDLQRALAESAALSNPLRGYQPSSSSSQAADPSKSLPSEPSAQSQSKPTRVQALYDFTGQTVEELEFKRGDVVRVVECLYEDWWKGENLRTGRIGIFPRNHVQPLPEEEEPSRAQPPPSQAPTEEDLESEVFAQVALVDRLLALMAQLREQGQDFADNDELTDLYNSSMRLRPRVVKLIRKYDQKQADLEQMNRKVDQARGIYEGMMQQRSQPQAVPPHGYPQSQTNGYHAHPHAQQPPPHAAEPYRAFSPAASATPSHYPAQHQHPHQQQPQQSIPNQAPPSGVDPAIEEQQRREYEQKWAEYERQMEEYNRQLAAHQQYYQQQGGPDTSQGQSPYPTGGPDPNDPRTASSPVPSLSRSQTTSSQTPIQSQPQPIWDGQAWVWPTQVAQVSQPPPPSPSHHPSQSPAHSPALASAIIGGGGATNHPPIHSAVASPPPNTVMYSSPPHHGQQQQQQLHDPRMMMGNLTEGVQGMNLNGQGQGQGGYYAGPGVGVGGEDPAQAQWAGR